MNPPKGWLERLNCAIDGILLATRTQKSLRFHFLAAFCVLLLTLLVKLPRTDLLILIFTIILVIWAELFNTALELVVDLLADRYHPLAKSAKDVAAGGVLIVSFGAAVIAYFTLFAPLNPSLRRVLLLLKHPPQHLAFVSLALVIVMVIVLKALWGKGTPLHGGMPSGHAAVGFALSTILTFVTESPLVMVLAFVLASLVSQSRLIHGIHTRMEVLSGALLGILVVVAIFQTFG
ncbi:MAG: diacylglycerol kinase [bacterium]